MLMWCGVGWIGVYLRGFLGLRYPNDSLYTEPWSGPLGSVRFGAMPAGRQAGSTGFLVPKVWSRKERKGTEWARGLSSVTLLCVCVYVCMCMIDSQARGV